MKLAIDQYGNMIEASANAPKKAICPYCKAIVVLRTRQRGHPQAGVTYYWRHENHSNPKCTARSWNNIFN